MDKQDVLNLRSLLSVTGVVSTLLNPVFDYESRLLSEIGPE